MLAKQAGIIGVSAPEYAVDLVSRVDAGPAHALHGRCGGGAMLARFESSCCRCTTIFMREVASAAGHQLPRDLP